MKKRFFLIFAALMVGELIFTSFKPYHITCNTTIAEPQNPVQLQEKKKRLEAMQKDIALGINDIRDKKGLQPLELKSEISRVAQIKGEDMLAEQYYVHKSSRYGMPDEMLRKYNVKFSVSGENIAWSGVFRSTVQEVLDGWMDIKADRDNILNPDFTKIGVGFAEDIGTRKYHWVVMFTD